MTRTVSTQVAEHWCSVCGARHARVLCLGEVLATEPERHGWRGTFVPPGGLREAVGVLIARSDRGWRARVLTYPRTLWTVPGTSCTMKFVADSAEQAERQAREFVEEHFRRRGHEAVENEGLAAQVGSYAHEQTRDAEGLEATRRRPCEIPVRLAANDGSVFEGTVKNVSERGLFAATDVSLPVGSTIRVQAELHGISVAMNGVVRSIRSRASAGRPRGLGVGLTDPPARYLNYVRRLP